MNSERNLEKLSKAELINLVEKLQNKVSKPKIAIVDNDNGQVPQPKSPQDAIHLEIQKQVDSLKSIQIDQNLQSNLPYQDYWMQRDDSSRDNSHKQ